MVDVAKHRADMSVIHPSTASRVPTRSPASTGDWGSVVASSGGAGNDVIETDPDLLLDFRGIAVRRDGVTLVGPVDWQVELDERWVVLGPNGIGKTTLLRIAACELYPSSGVAFVLGERLGRIDLAELRPRIGWSSAATGNRVPADEKVGDLVVSAGYGVLGRWRETYDELDTERAEEVLRLLGANHLVDREFGTLSEGERKRALIARSLMTDPELLLLDEPAAGLDLGGREDLVSVLSDLALDPDAPALVLVTHHVEEIPPGFTHALVLGRGGAVAAGPIEEVITGGVLSTAFDQNIVVEPFGDRWFARRGVRERRPATS